MNRVTKRTWLMSLFLVVLLEGMGFFLFEYLTQASTRPPTFVAFVNAKHLFHFSYQRYIINQIRENFGLEHTPIRLVVRERGSGEVGAKDV